ncbi:MAG TPA: glucose-6-phosphate isomerase [Rectinemataceae bacterium]|nr:glucose-6-phosphate isomerase [Rectinemataceae bacterium]
MPHYIDLDQSEAGKRLIGRKAATRIGDTLDAARVGACALAMGGGLAFNYAATPVDGKLVDLLGELARGQELVEKLSLLAKGEVMNTGEKRMVLHHLARGELAGPVVKNGRNYREFYEGERKRIAEFARKVRSGELRGSTGKTFTTAIQVGIGGSDLGPRALYLALERAERAAGRARLAARFISNVDPDDADAVIGSIDLASSLFILVSKSGTTQETLANETLVRARLAAAGLDPAKHFVAVTSETSPLAKSPNFLASFFMDDYIGGRYSSTSAVGGVILSLAFGPESFEELLEGAHEEDLLALEPDIRKNPSLLDALIGVWYRNGAGYGTTAILPYSEALSRFPAHLQQLDMESNGKRVNRFGKALSYATGPVIFGEPGTNGQHSFYQLLHQGTDVIPLQFIGFRENQISSDVRSEGSTSRAKLNANLAAQILAFALGKSAPDSNKEFPGGRPSTLIHGERLDAKALGALLAHFENKVAFQGFAWNLNSFDQEGVQLGKVLAKKVLAMDADAALSASGGASAKAGRSAAADESGAADEALAAYARLLGTGAGK